MTIATNNRENHFGEIQKKKMVLSQSGQIAQKYWQYIPHYFLNTKLNEFVIMPNHLHGIIEITGLIENLRWFFS